MERRRIIVLCKKWLLKNHEPFPILVFWEESINRNSIIMISKGYHCVITLSIVSNFHISIELAYPGSLPKDLSQRVNSWESGFSLLHRSSSYYLYEGIMATASIKLLCYIFTIPVHFIRSRIKFSKYLFLFTSLVFIFHIVL